MTLLDQLITNHERYQIQVALASFAFLARHTEALLPQAITNITTLGDQSRHPHYSEQQSPPA